MSGDSIANEFGKLEIHYINVGQGGSTLIIGPDGTRILYDFGKFNGTKTVVPYLGGLGWTDKIIHYSILSHRDQDHFNGYKGIVDSGYKFTIANYGPGGPEKEGVTLNTNWESVTHKTSAGAARQIPLGLKLALGNGAFLLVVARNGEVIDGTKVKVSNENDRSVSIFLNYNNFQYILDGDLGGGKEDCSRHNTGQLDVQTKVAQALMNLSLINKNGVDVMHVAHHGSESSTPAKYVNLMAPEVAMISVGNPNCSYRHPREAVMNTLLKKDVKLVGACADLKKVVEIYQTDTGSEGCNSESPISRTSNVGIISGDIKITTDGVRDYKVETTGVLWKNQRQKKLSVFSKVYNLDEII